MGWVVTRCRAFLWISPWTSGGWDHSLFCLWICQDYVSTVPSCLSECFYVGITRSKAVFLVFLVFGIFNLNQLPRNNFQAHGYHNFHMLGQLKQSKHQHGNCPRTSADSLKDALDIQMESRLAFCRPSETNMDPQQKVSWKWCCRKSHRISAFLGVPCGFVWKSVAPQTTGSSIVWHDDRQKLPWFSPWFSPCSNQAVTFCIILQGFLGSLRFPSLRKKLKVNGMPSESESSAPWRGDEENLPGKTL